ncbi:MAG: hypothetical protein Q9194_004219 [Teloschistes cf. exilis]
MDSTRSDVGSNVPDYLNNPNTGWIHTTPTCEDSTRCCIPDDDGWTTCFLRLALPASGQDCTTLNDHPCTAQAVLDPNLAPSILPQVRYTVMSIYGVHGFFAQYFDSTLLHFDFDAYQLTIETTGLNMAYAQALSVITDMTLLLDPDKTASISIFAVLSALTVGLAFLTAPSVAAGMLTMEASALYTAQSFAIGLQQAPGVARALWPSGDDLSRTYQIGQLQDQVSNITVELGNTLSRGLHILMTDVTTFVSFAENGRYSNNNPPLDPNVLKNNLAIVLQTYMLSQSIKQNGWYAIPLGVSTQAEYEALHDPPCFQTIHGCQPSAITVSQIYWSPVTGRQYQMWQKGGGPTGPGKILDEIKNAGWANMPLMFDGAFNCTAQGQLDNPQLVHVNFDGTLDASSVISDHNDRPFPADGCWDDPICWYSKTHSETTAAPTTNAVAKGHDGSNRPAAGRFLKEKWPYVAAGMGGIIILVALILGAWFWIRGRKQKRSARVKQRQIKRISSAANSVEGGRNGNGNVNVEAPIELGEMGEPPSAGEHETDEEISPAPDPGVWFRGRAHSVGLQRQLLARSERVKGIDFHPTEPWILTTLYSGHVYIWSYETQAIVKTFELTDVPVRAGRFIARKNWIVCGSDDFQVRVYNYNTSEKITSFEAHPDYIRAIVVHPTQSFVLTASDDMTIKLWDWDKGWKCVQIYEGHAHYVMGLAINPKDTNTFASACLDRTVKIWSFGSGHANYTLEAHETKGVNHVDYYPQADKPYLLTTSDDQTVKIWDYTTKSLIATLEGHTSNVSFACYHPELPIIISGSEDGTVKIWHANTYRLEQSLTYGLERAWCVSYQRGRQGVAVGFDDGAVVVKMGREEPAVSMDNSGKLIWARHSEVLSSVIKGGDATIKDGTPLSIPAKELGNCEIYPQTLQHSPNGRFVSVCGDGEYIIYTALAWRNKAFGSAQDFAWGSKDNSNDYAIRESSMSVRIFRNFKEKSGGIDVGFQAEGLSGGVLLGVRGQGGIGLFDWETGALVRRIEVEPKNVYWSESGELVTLACDETFYVLRYSRENYISALQAGQVEEDGVESAFEVVTDINESVRTGQWVGDCFIYTNSTNRLNYLVGDQTHTVSHFDQPTYLLGYLPRDGRAYVADKDVNVTSFALSLRVVEYQTLVLRGDMDTAAELLEDIPAEQKNKIARFLEGQGYQEMALEVATDPEHRFDLALSLNNLPVALEIAREANAEHRWKTVGDTALAAWNIVLAEECFVNAKDLGSLLLLYTSTGNATGLRDLVKQADEAAAFNIEFSCLWQLGDVDGCIDVLIKTGRTAEAVLFSQTYKPSRCRNVVGKWKEVLEKNGRGKVSRMLGVPPQDGEGDEELFPEWDEWLRIESEGKQGTGNLIDVSDGEKDNGINGADDTADGAESTNAPVEAAA